MSSDPTPYRGPNVSIAAASGFRRIVTSQEDVEVFRKYCEALRPIRDIDLPEGWRLRKGPPYLRLGVYVDCSLEEALAGAKAAAEQLGETLPENAGCMVIEDIYNRYIMKLLKLENHDRSDLLGSHPVYLPSSTGLPFDFLRWYEFCPNQVDDHGQEHRIYTLFMQPNVRRKVVSAIQLPRGVSKTAR